ncbi:serine/threonine protein kinase, CMGC, dual-specificity [Orobanche hederae]
MAINFVLVFAISMTIMAAVVTADSPRATIVKTVNNDILCDQGWECKGPSKYCCNETISDFFPVYQFENLFAKRQFPEAQANGFWDYQSFIIAASVYQPRGFGTTGGKLLQMKEVAVFLGHVGAKTSCGNAVSPGGQEAWGLCFKKEMSPSSNYCYEDIDYPCVLGVDYCGRGAIPMYGNKLYGFVGEGLKVDLLSHPEYVEQNATLAFQAAIFIWMTSFRNIPSCHDAFVGKFWNPTKNDTLSKRVAGFGTTINILYGKTVCGHGDGAESMNFIISHYLEYLDLMGVGREKAGQHLTCAQQIPFTRHHESFSWTY